MQPPRPTPEQALRSAYIEGHIELEEFERRLEALMRVGAA